jgi:UDP-N-acetylglucosamine 1-carboxyvinyltransferase
MEKFLLHGPTRLRGEVVISGAKNAALPILFTALLSTEPVEIKNIPRLVDIDTTIELLSHLSVKFSNYGNSIRLDASEMKVSCPPKELAKKMRAPIWMLAPLLARFGHAKVPLPGGCAIGARPVDLHISGLEQLGAKVEVDQGYLNATTNGTGLKAANIYMRKPSVGATVTTMSAAVLALGTTVIENAAREPEVTDVINFLNKIGAKISTPRSGLIVIDGVSHLRGGTHSVIPDRIETGTFLIAAAISRGKVTCLKTDPSMLTTLLNKLSLSGALIESGSDWVSLDSRGKRPKSVSFFTSPYPSFPTDMQPQFSLLNLIGEGTSLVTENIFENRLMHFFEFARMGACSEIVGNKVTCHGVERLSGAKVMATDLRSCASLVLAGCIAHGKTVIDQIYHIDRGYDNIEGKLRSLGANIQRVSSEEM